MKNKKKYDWNIAIDYIMIMLISAFAGFGFSDSFIGYILTAAFASWLSLIFARHHMAKDQTKTQLNKSGKKR